VGGRRIATVTAVLATLVAWPAGAIASQRHEEVAVRAVMVKWMHAEVAGHGAVACGLVTPDLRAEILRNGRDQCDAKTAPNTTYREARVSHVRLRSRTTALATVLLPGGLGQPYTLIKIGGRWLIAG
jgi:hypothetical protein